MGIEEGYTQEVHAQAEARERERAAQRKAERGRERARAAQRDAERRERRRREFAGAYPAVVEALLEALPAQARGGHGPEKELGYMLYPNHTLGTPYPPSLFAIPMPAVQPVTGQ